MNVTSPILGGTALFTFNISIGWDTLNNVMEVQEDYIVYTIFDIIATMLAVANFSITFFFCIFPIVPLVVTTMKYKFAQPGPLVYDPYGSKMTYDIDFIVPRTMAGVGLGNTYESDSDEGFTNFV